MTDTTRFADMFPDFEPIFVLGAARSGTTIVGDALRFGAEIPGCRESFLFSTAYLLMTHLEARWKVIGPGLEHFANEDRGDPRRERALSRFDFDEFLRWQLLHFHGLSVPHGERRWVDKTPDIYMVHVTPILAAAYPRGRWIFMKRNGVEVLDSRRRSHPEMTFEEACRDWATVMADWQRARAYVEGRVLEIDQREVGTDAGGTAKRITAFLGLDDEPRKRIAGVFTAERPGRTTTRTYDEVLTLDAADWTDAEKETFRRVCGDAMRAFGYAV